MRSRLRVILFLLSCMLFVSLCSTDLYASPTFLNRQAYPLPLGLTEIGHFHNNDLKTFEVWTHWNNASNERVVVKEPTYVYHVDPAPAAPASAQSRLVEAKSLLTRD